jgi:hypothetical protein
MLPKGRRRMDILLVDKTCLLNIHIVAYPGYNTMGE